MFTQDYIDSEGRGHGSFGSEVGKIVSNPGLYRPFIDDRGRECVVLNAKPRYNNQTGLYEPRPVKYDLATIRRRAPRLVAGTPAANAATLTQRAWIFLDKMVVEERRNRLRAWADAAARVSKNIGNAYSKMTVEYQVMNDPGEAVVDMDGLSEGRNAGPLFKTRSVPLPITHGDFYYSDRLIEVSRASGTPLDVTEARLKTRRVMEKIEDTLIGTETGITYGTQSTGDPSTVHEGTSTVYGYTNFTYRVTKTDLTTPDGTNPDSVVQDVIEMRETMYTNGYYGPFILYHSTSYDQWLDRTHFVGTFAQGLTTGSRNLREVISAIGGISDVRRLDRLTSGYQMILVQMDPEVIEVIDGMAPTVLQWDEQGGRKKQFRVWAIQVPMLKAPYSNTLNSSTTPAAGIIHGTTS